MPLFARKRASSQPPLPRGPPPSSSSAAIAASAAFLNKSPSAASLSSAAAAQALRSLTSSPEPVGSIQTKRMVRRGSQSSVASGAVMGGNPRNSMVRTTSNSSMTDRTFRSPSPGARQRAMSPAPDAPPVPAIPKNVIKSQRRAASLDVPNRISVPQSPSTPRSAKRNTSVDRAGRTLNLPTMPELKREDSSGVNFSRPMSPSRAVSPPPRPNSSVGWFTSPKVGNGTPRANPSPSPARPQSALGLSSPAARKIQQDVQNAANASVKKNKKIVAEGARLANGTMNTAPTGSAVRSVPQQPVQPKAAPATTPTQPIQAETPKKKKRTTVVPPVDTQASGGSSLAPVNPSPSTDASNSPNSPRPTSTLHKQPSMVREDPEAEASAEVQSKPKPKSTPIKTPVKHNLLRSLRDTDPGTLPGTITTSEGPVKAYVAPGGTRPRAASLDVPRGYGQRAGSSSPSRNVHAHFVEGSSLVTPMSIRHQPPPRSVSPMKSALRQSPASSVRNISPNIAANGRAKAPASETSDTTSLASQDGIKPAKVKKSVRISEDGSAPISPAVDPNARRELSGSWATDDINEIMKPRSALPSFSSVRGRKPEQAEKPEKVTETVSSSMTNSASTLPDHREASNDQLVGAVLAQHYAQKERMFDSQTTHIANEPLPPQVTSKETSADMSDSAYSEDETEPHVQSSSQPENTVVKGETASSSDEPKTSEHSAEAPEANPIEDAVPSLALQPPTPGAEEETESPLEAAAVQAGQRPTLKQRNSMPGSWDGEDWDEHNKPAALSRQAIRDEALLSENDSSDDEAAALQPAQATIDEHSPVLQPIYESDSDVSEDFADAEEDFHHGGFASLNAIVESPVVKPAAVIPSPPISPQAALPPSRATMSDSSALADEQLMTTDNTDWNSATAYWSSLSRTKKLELEAEAEAAIAAPVVESVPKSKKKRQPVDQLDITNPTTFAPAAISTRDDPFEAEEQQESRAPAMRKSMRTSGEAERTSGETQMRKSMRGPPAPAAPSNETHMRTSMRAGGSMRSEGSMRTSMRGDAGKPASKRVSAPVTTSIPGAGSAAAAAAKSQPAQKPTKPVVAPLPAYDSDSESSFKKNKRRGSVSTVDSVGKYTMKRSMRSGSVDAGPPPAERGRALSPPSSPPAKNGSGRFSLRSLSPTGSFMGRNQGEKIRQSLRGAPADDGPTMRGKNSRASRDAKAQSGFSMSGFGKAKAAPAPAPKARSGGFRSRFADSDDEDDAPRGAYRSRFADSDDEDSPIGPPKHMPANLAPVRGIPKRGGQDSDSTDLYDSEDEGRSGKKKTAVRASNKPAVPSQSDIDAAMEAARRNVAAMNGGREPGVPQAPPVPASNTTVPEAPMTPTRRKGFLGSVLRRNSSSVVPQSPVDSQHPRSPTTMRSPKQPKLQRRTTPQNWPLPAAPTNGDASNDPRPTTSDGVPAMKKSMRPDLNRRSMSGNDLNNMANGGTMQSASSNKKKKFSGLRKLFGLND
ncbi:hypothetical protein E4T48_07095 [Aureobasidium sp. EXF-10727]|nr:hypothetical protein E4T48_07095 [Aureobasidium sp. EXF-10727]